MAKKRAAANDELVLALKDHVAKLRLDLRRTQRRGFDASKVGRLTEGWVLSGGGPNADVNKALGLLRRRHQDLVDNNPWASKAVSVIVTNWVGARGIIGQPTGGGRSNKRVAAWKGWANSTACDFHGMHDLGGLQQLWARTIATRGSVLVRRRIAPELTSMGLPGLQLETLEPDWLDTAKRGSGILGGVQFDDAGRPAGYYLRNEHPLDGGLLKRPGSGEYVDRAEMIHAFDVRRPGQYDGVPWGVAAMLRLRDLDEYESAELLRQKIAACFAAFVTDAEAETDPTKILDLETLEPGAIENLPPGHDIRFATPPGAGDFVPFVRQQLYAVAAAYGVSYEALTGILSDVNYSGGRLGWVEFGRNVARWRHGIMIPQALSRVAAWFDEVAGVSASASSSKAKWVWTPPRRELVDPSRDVPALIEMIQAGFMSLSEVQRSLGFVPSEVLDELQVDLDEARGRGLVLTVDKSRDPNLLFAEDAMGADRPTVGSQSQDR